jgi:hypothetical protein
MEAICRALEMKATNHASQTIAQRFRGACEISPRFEI